MKRLIYVVVLFLLSAVPLSAQTATCTVTSTYGDGSTRYSKCPAGKVKVAKGKSVSVTPMVAPIPIPAPTPAPAPGTVQTITVAPGTGTLQAAVQQATALAKTGPVVLQLQAGATYAGNLTLPRTGAPYPITTTADPASLPAPGTRMDATRALPRIVPSLASSTVVLVQGDNYTLRGLNIVAPAVGVTHIDIDASVTPRPSNITIDQMQLRGSAAGGHRGVGANGINVVVSNSWCDRIWEVGRDAQCVAAWDAPGPLRIENNYIEASGEGILLGGSVPTCACVPTDVVITRNTITKDLAWKTMSPSPDIKNLIEIKFGRRVTITNNDISRNWQQAQTGWSILFTAMGIEGTAWTVVDGVTFARNYIHDIANGLNIAAVAGPVSHISVHDNVWRNVSTAFAPVEPEGGGRWAMLLGGDTPALTVSDVSITHETVIGLDGNQFLGFDGNPIVGFRMTHVVVEHRDYGVISSDGMAADALRTHAPGAVFVNNAILGAPRPDWTWPAGNFFLDVPIAAQFDAAGALLPTSPLYGLVTSDGTKVGSAR